MKNTNIFYKMKSKKRALSVIVIILSLVIGVISFWFMLNRDYQSATERDMTSSVPKILVDSVNDVVKTNPTVRNGDYTKVIQRIKEENWLNKKNKTVKFYSNFLIGYSELNKAKYHTALSYLNTAKENIDKAIDNDIKVRFYYELSYVQLHLKLMKMSNDSFNKVEPLYHGNSNINLLIPILVSRAYDLSHTDDGIELAILQTEKTLALAKSTNYEKIEHVYYTLGLNYWNGNQIVKGINYKIKAIELYMNKNKHTDVVFILTDIGIDYLLIGDIKNAIHYLTRALDYKLVGEGPGGESAYYIANQLYTAYSLQGDLVNAEKYLNLAKVKVEKIERKYVKDNHTTYLHLITADFYSRLNKHDNALEQIIIADERYHSGLASKIYHFDIKLNIAFGDIYRRNQDYNKSIKYYKRAEMLINQRDVFYLKDDINHMLYLSYKAIGNTSLTIYYLEKSNAIIKKQRDDHNEQYSQYIFGEFETKRKENEIDKLEQQSEISKLSLLFLFFILCGVMFFAFMLKYKNKKIVELNKSLAMMSFTDGLTAVSNRHALEQLWQTWETSASSQGETCSIIMIDIDYFKKYNDHYGHHEGDQTLKAVAQALQGCCRKEDFFGRYGGEEFIFVLPDTDKETAISIVRDRIQQAVAALKIRHETSEVNEYLTLSVGIATGKNLPIGAHETLIHWADKGLYLAKEQGRNGFVHLDFSPTEDDRG
ncbi:GGDEF domain-containing protein [Photobacterium japonica]|uniref:diguanylate cyclase n=1 Tax=Photobacterium japonica TaxID=2910235 RepID=UPI003D0EB949